VVISHILLKVVPLKGVGKEKTFTLSKVDTSTIHDCEELKKLIKSKLSEKISTEKFNVGYLDGSSTDVVRIRIIGKLRFGAKSTITVKSHFSVMAYFRIVEGVNLSI